MNKKMILQVSNAKKVKVRFVAKDNGQYEMWKNGQQVSSLVFNKNNHVIGGQPMKKADHFLVEFTLDDQTTAGNLQVPPHPQDAAWVCTPRQQNPPVCPTAASYDDEIFVSCVDPQDGTITLRNPDMTNENFCFTLRFLPKGADPKVQANYLNYDPIGQNQNGGAS